MKTRLVLLQLLKRLGYLGHIQFEGILDMKVKVYLVKLSGTLLGVNLMSIVDMAPGEELDLYIR